MQGKWNRHLDKTLCGGDKRGHDGPGDRVGEDEVGDNLMFSHPNWDSPDHDEALPYPPLFTNSRNITISERFCSGQDGLYDTVTHYLSRLLIPIMIIDGITH